MSLIILDVVIEGGHRIKGMGRRWGACMRTSLERTARFWHAQLMERHFTPRNASRYGHDPRNRVYKQTIKKEKGEGQGRYVDLILKGRSLRSAKWFASFMATPKYARVSMRMPSYFANPFVGTFTDQQTGRLKRVTRQPDKVKELTTVSAEDRADLRKEMQRDLQLRATLALLGVGR